MANYLTTDTDLTSVANAIRTKGGTSAQLAFPAGFVQAIADIPTGGGGLNYDLRQVNVTSNSPTVDRFFDDFIFVAQIDTVPAAADRGRLYSDYVHFVFKNGELISGSQSTKTVFVVMTQSVGATTFQPVCTNATSLNVSDTVITFTLLGGSNIQQGTWNVLQIELPPNDPFYYFYGLT